MADPRCPANQDALERRHVAGLRVPNDADTLDGPAETRRIHECAEKASQLVNAAEVLYLYAGERQLLCERLEKVTMVVALYENLDGAVRSHTLQVQRTSISCFIAAPMASGSYVTRRIADSPASNL